MVFVGPNFCANEPLFGPQLPRGLGLLLAVKVCSVHKEFLPFWADCAKRGANSQGEMVLSSHSSAAHRMSSLSLCEGAPRLNRPLRSAAINSFMCGIGEEGRTDGRRLEEVKGWRAPFGDLQCAGGAFTPKSSPHAKFITNFCVLCFRWLIVARSPINS